MHLEDDERKALANIEAELSGADPEFSRRFRRSQSSLPQRPGWRVLLVDALRRERWRPAVTPTGLVDVRHAVVVGCDGKPHSDAALRYAVAEADRRSARLLVVTTYVRPVDPDLDTIETPEGTLQARARRSAESALCRALALPDNHLPPHQILTERGEVSRVLLSRYGDAELIVLGSHQRRLPHRIIRGRSTSRTVVRKAHVPVVVVPPRRNDG